DGIRDKLVTGVQTCALPISDGPDGWSADADGRCSAVGAGSPTEAAGRLREYMAKRKAGGIPHGIPPVSFSRSAHDSPSSRSNSKIGRASCRERVSILEVHVS